MLALLGEGAVVLQGVEEPDLVRYLVAAHHGRIRLGFRPLRDETPGAPEAPVTALGVIDGDLLPAVDIPIGEVPASSLVLDCMAAGASANGEPSWAQRALTLRDRADLGPFRLGFLEAVVRMADWRGERPG